ncbi:hypothetical protein GQ457_07G001850 [Hibiscus cannabinus]
MDASVLTRYKAFIQEHDALDQAIPKLALVGVSTWQPPPESLVKFNFDSAFNSYSGSATTGVIGRNSQGSIMASCSFPHKNVADAFVAEAYARKQRRSQELKVNGAENKMLL